MSAEDPVVEATRAEPPVTAVAAPFWDATRRGELVLQWCVICERAIFFPRAVCPYCLGSELVWRQASGRGTIYAVTVEHRAQDPRMASRVPYAVAIVELAEGVRMMSNIINCPPELVNIDMAVTVTWEPLSDGRQLPLFEPVGA